MIDLTDQPTQSCNKENISLSNDAIEQHLMDVHDWQLIAEHGIQQITKTFTFKNFVSAIDFANQVTILAEQENHHPRICIEWGKTSITWWTHSVSGLFINDFIMAARCNHAYQQILA